MKRWCFFVCLGLLGMVATNSCSRETGASRESSANPVQATNLRVFEVKGVIKAIRPDQKEIEIRHEAIPGYMPAMTMPFDVKDPNELTGLAPGQPVSFRLSVTDTEGWVDKLRALGPAVSQPQGGEASQLTRVVRLLKIGEPLPEFHLTNQLGQAFTTTQFKGQALAITFLFTRCPFPTFCPRLANDFADTQQQLLSMHGSPTNWHLLTITIDPEFDTPKVLESYAGAHRYDPVHWTFATGAPEEIASMGDLFGLIFGKDPNGSITHNMRTAVIDAKGRLQTLFEGKDWTSSELVAEITKAAKQ